MNLTLLELARLLASAPDLMDENLDAGVKISGVTIDSRKVRPGDVFFALPGSAVDGHDFVSEALRKGASAVVVGRPVESDPARTITVSDPMESLVKVAGWVRDVINPLVVGVTGSVGKTSVKDLLHAILRPHMSVVASEGSFNNELGVPLTLLRARSDTRVVISEMGTRGPGQIAQLCEIARPHIGVVTNVGITHYETFGSRTAIARAKGELVEALPDGGAVILNADDPLVMEMAKRRGEMVEEVSFGLGPQANLRAWDVRLDEMGRPTFRMAFGAARGVWVSLPVSGIHQVANALAASAAATALGLTLEDCREGLESATISPWRMEVRRVAGSLVVNDAYNSSPASVVSALRTCFQMRRNDGRLVVVLGQMAELGALTDTEGRRVGALTASLASRLVVVGDGAGAIAHGARQEGMTDVTQAHSPEEAAAAVGELQPGDVLLIKGSRVTGLEAVADLVGERMAGR